jgi:hypothetical protein
MNFLHKIAGRFGYVLITRTQFRQMSSICEWANILQRDGAKNREASVKMLRHCLRGFVFNGGNELVALPESEDEQC